MIYIVYLLEYRDSILGPLYLELKRSDLYRKDVFVRALINEKFDGRTRYALLHDWLSLMRFVLRARSR